MGTMTYYVALAFKKDEDEGGDIVACDPREARSSEQAIRMAASLAVEEDIAEPSRFLAPVIRLLAILRTR
jgi:hypothetical protein